MKKWQKIVFSVCMSAILCVSATGCDTIKWLLSPQEQSSTEPLTAVETVYAKAQELGFKGTLEEFLELVKGADGKDGIDGADGKDGKDGIDGADGKDGVDGKDGADGVGVLNAYLENGALVVELTNGKKINCGVIVERATHTVSFDANGGEKIPSQEVKHGEKADKPTDPKKEGYIFDGWYIGEEKWSFIGYSVTEDITLTAKWSPKTTDARIFTVMDDVTLTYGNDYNSAYLDANNRASIQPYGITIPAGAILTAKEGYQLGFYNVANMSKPTEGSGSSMLSSWTKTYTNASNGIRGITIKKVDNTDFDFTTDSVYIKDYLTITVDGIEKPELFKVANEYRSNWVGKKAVFIGDSITYGAGTTEGNRYWELLNDKLGFDEVVSYGVSGSCISANSSYGTANQPLVNRWEKIASENLDADLVYVFMGTNDYGHSTPLGTIADTTDVSFYGALDVVLKGLKEKLPKATIVCMTPLHRTGDTSPRGAGVVLEDYVTAIKAVCDKYFIPVVDAFSITNFNPNNATVKTTYFPDGLHPNEAGHAFLVNEIAKEINEFGIYASLRGLKISILGDSISTLEGISDNVAYNTTLSPNQSRYYAKDVAYTTTEATLELTSWEDTYWGQTVNDLNLELCVNNSWRGTSVSTARGASSCTSGTRATQLHNDNENIMPDIIVIYIGTNDKNSKAPVFGYNSIDDVYDGASYTADCSYFDIAYATMVLKVKNKYPNADIYLCNLIYNDTLGQSYNKSIEKIATEFDCNLVDFSSLVPVWSWSGHTMDGLHPNKDGFDLMADILTRTIQETYMQN